VQRRMRRILPPSPWGLNCPAAAAAAALSVHGGRVAVSQPHQLEYRCSEYRGREHLGVELLPAELHSWHHFGPTSTGRGRQHPGCPCHAGCPCFAGLPCFAGRPDVHRPEGDLSAALIGAAANLGRRIPKLSTPRILELRLQPETPSGLLPWAAGNWVPRRRRPPVRSPSPRNQKVP